MKRSLTIVSRVCALMLAACVLVGALAAARSRAHPPAAKHAPRVRAAAPAPAPSAPPVVYQIEGERQPAAAE